MDDLGKSEEQIEEEIAEDQFMRHLAESNRTISKGKIATSKKEQKK